jgi:hypothetical protein
MMKRALRSTAGRQWELLRAVTLSCRFAKHGRRNLRPENRQGPSWSFSLVKAREQRSLQAPDALRKSVTPQPVAVAGPLSSHFQTWAQRKLLTNSRTSGSSSRKVDGSGFRSIADPRRTA